MGNDWVGEWIPGVLYIHFLLSDKATCSIFDLCLYLLDVRSFVDVLWDSRKYKLFVVEYGQIMNATLRIFLKRILQSSTD